MTQQVVHHTNCQHTKPPISCQGHRDKDLLSIVNLCFDGYNDREARGDYVVHSTCYVPLDIVNYHTISFTVFAFRWHFLYINTLIDVSLTVRRPSPFEGIQAIFTIRTFISRLALQSIPR